jgi:hypothetical protein
MPFKLTMIDDDRNYLASPSLLERILGAVLAFFFFSVTLILLPIIAAAKSFGFWLPTHIYNIPFLIWVSIVSGAACIYGIWFGVGKVIEVLSYLWYTAEPPDRRRSDRLWGMIAIVGALTFIGSVVINTI